MHPTTLISFLAVFSIAAVSALPLGQLSEKKGLLPRQRNYSVVNVDGGESTTSSAAPVVTHTVTTTEAPPPPAETIYIPDYPPSDPLTETIYVTQSNSTVTSVVTFVPPQPSTSVEYYDDGMWHTSYPIKSTTTPHPTEATSTPCPDESTTAGAPTASAPPATSTPCTTTSVPSTPTPKHQPTSTLTTAYLPSDAPRPHYDVVDSSPGEHH